jgi:UTP:GlnB (protein PII) uridylyltransferase
MYTHPQLRDHLKSIVMAGRKGGAPGQWSARKAQLLAKLYKDHGGGYKGPRSRTQRSLTRWTRQRWRTRSGKPSTQGPHATGERYLPEAAICLLTPSQYGATTRAKREGIRSGRQFVPNTPRARSASKRVRSQQQ